jgi:drug/metabolite transporter (DMT)-like permease
MTQSMIITLGLVIIGQIVYQIGQRAVPANAPPLAVFVIAYFGAGLLCLALAWPFGTFAATVNWKPALAWPTWVLAAAVVAIEVGYLSAYRAGWTLGTAFATASTITVVTLAAIDWMAHGNSLSGKQLLGLGCSCLGVWLISAGRPS